MPKDTYNPITIATRSAMNTAGRALIGYNEKTAEFILDETIVKYKPVEFLSKKKARDTLRILEEVKNNKKLTRAIDGFVGGYLAYVSSSLKNVIPWLKNYIKFWDGLKKSGSVLQLQKFKGDLIENLKSIKHILELDEQKHNKYSMNEVMKAAKAAEGKYEGNLTLADYLKSVLLPTVTNSITNLEGNDIEKCAIYIGGEDTELGDSKSGVINTGGAKLNYGLLEMKEEKQIFEKGVSKTINKKMKLFGKISEGNKKILEELRKSCNKYLKKSEGILQKIEGRLEELNSHGEAKSRNSLIDDEIKNYQGIEKAINACIEGGDEAHNNGNNLRGIYGTLAGTENITVAKDCLKKVSPLLETIEGLDKNASIKYKIVLKEIEMFEKFMSDTAKLKKGCKKYTDVIVTIYGELNISPTNSDMDMMSVESIKRKYNESCGKIQFFSGKGLDKLGNISYRDWYEYDIGAARTEVQNACKFIKDFYRVSVKLKKLSKLYDGIINKDKPINASIDETVMNSYKTNVKGKFVTDQIKNVTVDNLNNFEKGLDGELKEAKEDLVCANKFREAITKAQDFENKYKEKAGTITKDMESFVVNEVYDRKHFRDDAKKFSDKYERRIKEEKTDSLKKSTKRIDRLKRGVRGMFSRSSRKEIEQR